MCPYALMKTICDRHRPDRKGSVSPLCSPCEVNRRLCNAPSVSCSYGRHLLHLSLTTVLSLKQATHSKERLIWAPSLGGFHPWSCGHVTFEPVTRQYMIGRSLCQSKITSLQGSRLKEGPVICLKDDQPVPQGPTNL